MNISIITSAFGTIPPYGIGAVEKLWYDLGVEFAKHGHHVTFYSKQPEENYAQDGHANLEVVYIKGYKRTSNRYTDIIWDVIYSLKALGRMKRTDVVVLNTVFSPILCRFFKKKFGVSVYNVARFPRGQFRFYKHLDRLVPCSSMIGDAVLKQTPEVKAILKTINNPVNTAVFVPKEKENHSVKNIVFTGRIHPEKGLLNLVKAADRLCDTFPVKLTLVGPSNVSQGGGGNEYVAQLKEAATKVELDFVGAISNPAELASAIQAADVYCYPPLPTTGDAMPCAPLEAMATATPVVLSNLPCFSDYAEDKKNCLMFDVHENAVENLYETFKTLLSDEQLQATISTHAAKTAAQFSNENIAKKFLQDFEELLTAKSRRANSNSGGVNLRPLESSCRLASCRLILNEERRAA